jgi:hypothetical protein
MDLTAYEYDSQRAYKSPKWQNNSNVSSTAKSRCVNRDLGQAKVAPFLFFSKVILTKQITYDKNK